MLYSLSRYYWINMQDFFFLSSEYGMLTSNQILHQTEDFCDCCWMFSWNNCIFFQSISNMCYICESLTQMQTHHDITQAWHCGGQNHVFLGSEVAIFAQKGGIGENISTGSDWELKDMPQWRVFNRKNWILMVIVIATSRPLLTLRTNGGWKHFHIAFTSHTQKPCPCCRVNGLI